MRSLTTMICGSLFLGATAAAAEVPRVVADIAPVHSLVARVMQGVGAPDLILPPGSTPHGHAMRPSQADLLADAELIFWTGEALTPWLGSAIETLAPQATAVELLEASGTRLLEYRESATFEPEDHADEAEEHVAEQTSALEADAHDATAGSVPEDGHGAEEAADPHAWLDPHNARAWLAAIATALSQADPANAGTYAANATAGASEIDALAERLAAELAPVRGRPFVVFHDGYHYFERHFEIEAAGAIALGDGSEPSPARIQEVRDRIVALDAACVFTEPQYDPRLVATVTEGTRARSGPLDALGASLTPGPDLYPQLMQGLSDGLVGCLG